jgi:hypothetical protein
LTCEITLITSKHLRVLKLVGAVDLMQLRNVLLIDLNSDSFNGNVEEEEMGKNVLAKN